MEANLQHQSRDYDIKSTVLSNIYARLDLEFGLLRATTPRYTSYSYQVQSDTSKDRTTTAAALRAHSLTKAKWTYIDVDKTARLTLISRHELIAKLNSWHDERLIDLRASGVLNVFNLLKPLPTAQAERRNTIDQVYADLEARERQALDRMEAVMNLVTSQACFARTLAQHFGDPLPEGEKQECGHCTWCETKQAVTRVTAPTTSWDSTAFKKLLASVPARDDPRFLARVAFGKQLDLQKPSVSEARC